MKLRKFLDLIGPGTVLYLKDVDRENLEDNLNDEYESGYTVGDIGVNGGDLLGFDVLSVDGAKDGCLVIELDTKNWLDDELTKEDLEDIQDILMNDIEKGDECSRLDEEFPNYRERKSLRKEQLAFKIDKILGGNL